MNNLPPPIPNESNSNKNETTRQFVEIDLFEGIQILSVFVTRMNQLSTGHPELMKGMQYSRLLFSDIEVILKYLSVIKLPNSEGVPAEPIANDILQQIKSYRNQTVSMCFPDQFFHCDSVFEIENNEYMRLRVVATATMINNNLAKINRLIIEQGALAVDSRTLKKVQRKV